MVYLQPIPSTMDPDTSRLIDPYLYRRGRMISVVNRGIALACGAVCLVLLWGDPRTQRTPTLVVAGVYALYTLAAAAWSFFVRRPWSAAAKITQNLVEALAVGGAAYSTGGLRSQF